MWNSYTKDGVVITKIITKSSHFYQTCITMKYTTQLNLICVMQRKSLYWILAWCLGLQISDRKLKYIQENLNVPSSTIYCATSSVDSIAPVCTSASGTWWNFWSPDLTVLEQACSNHTSAYAIKHFRQHLDGRCLTISQGISQYPGWQGVQRTGPVGCTINLPKTGTNTENLTLKMAKSSKMNQIHHSKFFLQTTSSVP